MKHLKTIFACLLVTILSIGQVWGLTNTYTKITSATSLDESAEYVIGDVDNYGCPTNTGGTAINTTEASWVHWNAKNVDGGFYLYNGAVYLKVPTSNAWGSGTSSDCSVLTANSEGILAGNDGTNDRILVKNSSNAYLRWYKSGQTKAYLYKIEASSSTACATPTFSPEAGSYEGAQNVTITSTDGATIYYTTDGSTPTTSSSVYSSSISVSADMTIKAYAVKSGLDDSEVATAAYTITEGPDVTLDFTSNTEWAFPTSKQISEGTYSDGTYTVKVAGSTGNGFNFNSGKLLLGKLGAYLILPEFEHPIARIECPGVSGASGSVTWNVFDGDNAVSTEVTGCTADKSFEIEPLEANKEYTIKVTNGNNLQISKIKIFFGTAPAVAKPTISGEASFLSSTTVTITQNDAEHIYYTTDGSNPTTGSTPYSAPFSLDATATVKAIAVIGSDKSEVAEKTFTKATVLTVAEAIAAIPNKDDVVNNQYVEGIVCTAGTSVNASGQMTYYISADGTEATRLQIYLGKNLNNTAFTAVSDLAIGDRVVVFGQLKNYNNTPEMNSGNYLVSKEIPAVAAPVFSPDGGGFMGETDVTITCETAGSAIYYTTNGETPSKSSTPYTAAIHLDATTTITAIAYVGDDASLVIAKTFTLTAPMTVAEALAALESENPINNVAVAGIISTAPTANPSSGKLTYFISDDGSASDELEVYKGFGVAGASFSDKADLQVGDEVTVFGNLTIYNTTKEFAEGNRLLVFNRPQVDVESINLTESTASVEEGKTVTLHASVVPANATNKTIVWSVQSGNDKASVDNGVVTGIEAGTAVIRAASDEDASIYAECTVTVTEPAPLSPWASVYTSNVELSGSQNVEVTITVDEEDKNFDGVKMNKAAAATFTIPVGTTNLYAHMAAWNGEAQTVTVSGDCFDADKSIDIVADANISGSGTTYDIDDAKAPTDYFKEIVLDKEVTEPTEITITAASGKRFVLFGINQVGGIALESIAISGTASNLEYNDGDHFNPAGLVVTGTYSDASTAPITTGIDWTFDPDPLTEGTTSVSVTATVGEISSDAVVVNGLTVAAAPAPTSGNVVILAEYGSKFYAMSNTLNSNALVGVEVEKDGSNIVVSSAEDKAAIQWTATVDGDNTTLKDANDNYIKGSSTASLSLDAAPFNWTWDSEKSCYINSGTTSRGLFFSSTSNVFKGYSLQNITDAAYAAIEVIEIDPANIVISSKVNPELAYTPASDEITVGDAWSAPALGYVEGFDGLEAISYESNNEAVATVSDAGVIALAGGTGTATITATFGGNASYLAGSATYTVKVNPVIIPDDCDATDDFSTVNTNNPTGYADRSTTNGWTAVNAMPKTIDEDMYLTINGKTSAVGVITSPVLSDGIASLKFRYANTFSESNGVSVRIDIKQGEDVVKTYTVTKANSEVTQNTVYTEEIENINVAGEFQIIFTNLSPSNNTGNKDRLSIGRLCWKNYSSTPEPPTPVYETVREDLTPNHYYTICYPKAMTDIQGATLWSFVGKDANFAYIEQETATTIEAGKPYIMYATASTVTAVLGDETNAPGANGAIHGTLSNLTQDQLNTYATVAGSDLYLVIGDKLCRVTGYALDGITPLTGNSLPAQRAFVVLSEIPGGAPEYMPGRNVRKMPMPSNTPTDIEGISVSDQPVKMMIDGQLFILRDGKMFNANGQLVK